MTAKRLIAAGFALAVLVRAQDWQTLKDAAPIRPPLPKDSVENALQNRAVQAAGRIQHPGRRQDIDATRLSLRKRLKDSLGYERLPWPPELSITTYGTLSRAGYRIEKLGLRTIAGALVPAHVYVPEDLTSRAPAILFITGGRTQRYGKSDIQVQTFAINMARLGFVVMIPDPIGAGERGTLSDHNRQALLVGLARPGVTQYEIQCGLRYLLSRNDVDPQRIGITGADGGGFDTWLTGALDDRIAVMAPVDDTFDFTDEVARGRSSDWAGFQDERHLVPGILQYANIHEFIALSAPRPLMIVAGADAVPLQEYGQRVYAWFDQVRRIHIFLSEGTAYERSRRQAVYGFFLWALKHVGDGAPASEPLTDVEPPNSPELKCLGPGETAPVASAIAEAVHQLAAHSAPAGLELSRQVLAGDPPPIAEATLGINSFPIHRRNLLTGEGIEIPVTILRPGLHSEGGLGGTLLALDDRDKESLASDPIIQEALRRNYLVVALDPRGFGELAVTHPNWVAGTSLLLGESFVWRQAWDLKIRLNSFPFVRPNGISAIYARGPNAALAAAYAIWLTNSRDLAWAVLRNGYSSVQQLLNSADSISDNSVSFGALSYIDIPQMLASVSTKVFLIDPIEASTAKDGGIGRVRITTAEEFVRAAW